MAAKEHFEDCTDGPARAARAIAQCRKVHVLGLPSSLFGARLRGRDQNDLPAATLCPVSLFWNNVHVYSLLSFSNSAMPRCWTMKTPRPTPSRHRAIVMFVSQVSYKCSPCSTKSTDTSDIKQGNHTVSKSR